MIYLFTGTPGSGKSLDMARCIINDLRFSRPCICNFPISVPKKYRKRENLFHYVSNEELNPSDLVRFSNDYFKNHRFKEGAICLYIDECQLLFNARTWNAKGRNEWNAFFTNHRHFGYDIVLICQFDRMLDRQIRSLVETQVVHRKLNQMGIKGMFFRVLFLAPTLFIKVSFYYPLKLKTNTKFFRYKASYARIYDSYTSVFIKDVYADEISEEKNEAGKATEERKEDLPASFLLHRCSPEYPFFYKIALFALVFLA